MGATQTTNILLATDLDTDPRCSRTTDPDMALDSSFDKDFIKVSLYLSVHHHCVVSSPTFLHSFTYSLSFYHILLLSHLSITCLPSIAVVPTAGGWVSFFRHPCVSVDSFFILWLLILYFHRTVIAILYFYFGLCLWCVCMCVCCV
jgi:hypothetical protein